MKPRLIVAIILAAIGTTASAQTTAPSSTSKKNDRKLLTITGCIGEDPSNAGTFTLADVATGSAKYRLTGVDIRQYLGMRVSLTGAELPPKLAIAGGLVPSPNVAAQAGAMDPSRAAVKAQTEGSTKPGNISVPELRVRSAKAIVGGCEHP